MNEAAYASYVKSQLGDDSVGSYLSYLRRVERELAVNLDQAVLSEPAIVAIGRNLDSVGIPRKSVINCLAALRSYARFKSAK